MTVYRVLRPKLTELASERVERTREGCSRRQTNQQISWFVAEMKPFLPMCFCHILFLFFGSFFPVCRAPLQGPHAAICLFLFFSRLWLRFTSAPVLLALPLPLFYLAAPPVSDVRLHPHLSVFPDKWGQRRRQWRTKGAALGDWVRQSLVFSCRLHCACATPHHRDFCIYFGRHIFKWMSSEKTGSCLCAALLRRASCDLKCRLSPASNANWVDYHWAVDMLIAVSMSNWDFSFKC